MTNSYGEAGVVKILQEAMKVPETKVMAKNLEAEMLKDWLTNGLSPDGVFKMLKLDKVGDTLFSNPVLVSWTKYMNAFNQKNPDKSVTLIATLAAHYGDDGIAAMLKSSDASNKLALTMFGEKLLENRQLLGWLMFVDDPRRSKLATSLMTSLTTTYGDVALVNLIEAAKKVANTKDVATKLQVNQFQYWANIGKSPDDVFKLYLLNKAGDDLLSSPRLAEWSNYVKVFNQQNPKHQSSLLTVMTKSFGDDGVVQILEAAKKVSSTASTAKRLESEQIQRWLLMSTDDVFKLLKLDKAGEKMFGSPQLNVWGKYVSAFNTENPDKKMSLIAALTTHYGDDGVITMLDAAKKVPSTETIATRLQSEQLQHWLSTDKDPATVFTLFKLDKIGRDKLLASPQFSTYIKYADNFFIKNPNKSVTTIGVVRLKYGDNGLATMILAAEKEPGMQKIVKRVEQELFQAWKADLRTPDEAFENLRLGSVGDNLLESPLFGYYTRFLNDYNNVHPGKEATMISALTTHYDDEALTSMLVASKKVPSTEKLATKLQGDQIKAWLAEKDPILKPDELFKSLRLDESVDDLLTSPFLDTWASYLNAYNAKYPPGDNVLMTDIFRAAFGDQDLIRMLIKAKEVPSTKKIATSLQASLLKQWFLDRAPPENVAKVLKAGGVADDVNAEILAAYTTKFKETYG